MTAAPESSLPKKPADLVLEGGGVKGIALVGAVQVLADAGFSYQRIAGTSAGAMVASVVAALAQAGEPTDRLLDITRTIDYTKFPDRGPIGSLFARLGASPIVDGLSVLLDNGIYEGKYLHDWMSGVLEDLGVRTFGDLRLPDDPDTDLPENRRYRLVVVTSDVSRQRMVRLPWDYHTYGLDPDEQSVADAIRASTSIPFFFEPVTLRHGGNHSTSTLVDGGVLSSFPITTFDRTDGKAPRWPTLGVRLSARERANLRAQPVGGPLALVKSLVSTMMDARDSLHVAEACNITRTVFIDTDAVDGTDFEIDEETQQMLLHGGRAAAESFLETWSFEEYVRTCRGGEQW